MNSSVPQSRFLPLHHPALDSVERQLSLLRVRYLGEQITQAIEQAGFNHEKEVEEARQEAWQEYKTTHLPNI